MTPSFNPIANPCMLHFLPSMKAKDILIFDSWNIYNKQISLVIMITNSSAHPQKSHSSAMFGSIRSLDRHALAYKLLVPLLSLSPAHLTRYDTLLRCENLSPRLLLSDFKLRLDGIPRSQSSSSASSRSVYCAPCNISCSFSISRWHG